MTDTPHCHTLHLGGDVCAGPVLLLYILCIVYLLKTLLVSKCN